MKANWIATWIGLAFFSLFVPYSKVERITPSLRIEQPFAIYSDGKEEYRRPLRQQEFATIEVIHTYVCWGFVSFERRKLLTSD